MLTPGVTGWSDVAPVLLTALAVLFVPGVVSARLAGVPWFSALGIGPVLSTTIVAAGGVVAAGLGQPWGLAALSVTTAVVWALQIAGHSVVGLVRRRRSRRRGLLTSSGGLPQAPTAGTAAPSGDGATTARASASLLDWVVLAGSLACTALAVGVVLVQVSGSPEAFPQHPDTIFHLGTAQWMAEHRDVSVLHAAGFLSASGTGAYPAAFHAMTATVTMLTGVPAVVATSCFVLIAAGVAWPAALVVLARTLFGPRPSVTLSAAASSVLFTAFPFMLMGFGVLWPNLYGQVLLPGALALGAAVLAPLTPIADPVLSPTRAGLVLLAALPGLTLAHPNALLTFMHLGLFAMVLALGATAWRRRRANTAPAWLLAVGAAVLPLAFAVGLTAVRPATMVNTGAPGPELSVRSALVDTILFAPRSAGHLPALTILAGVGALVVFRRHRSAWWVPVSAGYLAVLFYLNVAVDTPAARYLTWPWYNNAVRIAAVGVLPAALLAAAAFAWAAAQLSRVARRWRVTETVASALVIALFLGGTLGYVGVHKRWLNPFFHPTKSHSWASPAELRALYQFGKIIPSDAVTAANPWNGGTYLYVVSGRRLLVPTEKGLSMGDRMLLAATLDQAGKDPFVCEAARRQHVEYAIVGGRPFAWATGQSLAHYHGFDAVAHSPAFTPVAHAGPYTLYRLTRCAAG